MYWFLLSTGQLFTELTPDDEITVLFNADPTVDPKTVLFSALVLLDIKFNDLFIITVVLFLESGLYGRFSKFGVCYYNTF